jgi:hypothetical protein
MPAYIRSQPATIPVMTWLSRERSRSCSPLSRRSRDCIEPSAFEQARSTPRLPRRAVAEARAPPGPARLPRCTVRFSALGAGHDGHGFRRCFRDRAARTCRRRHTNRRRQRICGRGLRIQLYLQLRRAVPVRHRDDSRLRRPQRAACRFLRHLDVQSSGRR